MHPDGDAVVTAMQENALHGWRLSDGQHMRMSGYPAKTRIAGVHQSGKWLATSGADAMVLWPFFGGGPMGKAPMELAGGDGVMCTRVAAHPPHEMVAGGFADGLVVLADIGSSRILPVVPPGHGPITALAWSPARHQPCGRHRDRLRRHHRFRETRERRRRGLTQNIRASTLSPSSSCSAASPAWPMR